MEALLQLSPPLDSWKSAAKSTKPRRAAQGDAKAPNSAKRRAAQGVECDATYSTVQLRCVAVCNDACQDGKTGIIKHSKRAMRSAKPHKWKVTGLGETDLAGFLIKLNFTRKITRSLGDGTEA